MSAEFGTALLLSTAAGLCTGIGSLLGVTLRPGPRFMSASLGFAAGIMIFIAFGELLPHAVQTLGLFGAHVAFFVGLTVMFLVDIAIPHQYMAEPSPAKTRPDIRRTSTLLAVGIFIHNLPEGMATFATALEDLDLGIAMAAAIAAHNIPEGLVVSAPVYAVSGSRRRAFAISMLSGLAEPVGALLAAVLLVGILNPQVLAATLAGVAGLMVFISLDELVPSSKEYGYDHTAIISAGAGMAVMAASIHLLM